MVWDMINRDAGAGRQIGQEDMGEIPTSSALETLDDCY